MLKFTNKFTYFILLVHLWMVPLYGFSKPKNNLLDYCSQREGECQKIAKEVSSLSKYSSGMQIPVYITALENFSGKISVARKQPFSHPTAMFMVKVGEMSVASVANSSMLFESNSIKLLGCVLFRKRVICSSDLEWYNKEKGIALVSAKLKVKLQDGKVAKVLWGKFKSSSSNQKNSLNGSMGKKIRKEKDLQLQVLIGWEGTEASGQIVSVPFPEQPPNSM